MPSTLRQRRGSQAEQLATEYLRRLGWRVIARNIELGGVEVDILAVDSGPPSTVVVVEVRSLHAARFGAPEERVDRAKVGRLYRALTGLREADGLLTDVASSALRVDLVVVDRRLGHEQIRHIRALEPA